MRVRNVLVKARQVVVTSCFERSRIQDSASILLIPLVQRRDELTERIDDLNTLIRLDGWTPNPDSQLAAAVNQRVNHLAYEAITSHDQWVANVICHGHAADPTITTDKTRRLILDVAAYRERTGHTGPDPIGPVPTDHMFVEMHQHITHPADGRSTCRTDLIPQGISLD